MLKILIYEYITGGGLINEDLSYNLLNEAKLMVSELYKDLKELKHISFKFLLLPFNSRCFLTYDLT